MKLGYFLSVAVLVGAFLWSAITVATRTKAQLADDVKVIRIGHWQLESGVREAFDQLGAEFAALPHIQAKYGKIKIDQEAIPEYKYGVGQSARPGRDRFGASGADLAELSQSLFCSAQRSGEST
jgi:hypothetical protein